MYKVASDRRQAALHRGRPSDWVNGQERLSDADKIKQLQDGINILETRIRALAPGSEERKRLGKEKLALQTEISELRKQVMREVPLEWRFFFVNEARRLLSRSQFDMIYNAAIRECKRSADQLGRPSDCDEKEKTK